MMEKGLFRKDLYFRLSVIKIHVPSLNERSEDILPLAKHFLMQFSRKFNKTFSAVAPEAEKALLAYRWTGNVRELMNLIERAVLIGKGPELALQDLQIKNAADSEIRTAGDGAGLPPLSHAGIDLRSVQESLEAFYIREALKLAKGNESKAAALLHLNHHTFRYRRRKLHIE
jgi:DNA-binding NtrC family response regulator